MKLRIEGNSIRLRLKKSEMDLFAKNKKVEDVLNIATSNLVYVLEITSKTEISSQFLNNKLKSLYKY